MDDESKMWILFDLQDAHEDLTRIIADLKDDPDCDETEYRIDMAHLYHHINSAWNARHATVDEIGAEGKYKKWGQFPQDIEPL